MRQVVLRLPAADLHRDALGPLARADLMVISEMQASTDGIGFLRAPGAASSFAIPDMWSASSSSGSWGYASNAIFVTVERRLLRWHEAPSRARSRMPPEMLAVEHLSKAYGSMVAIKDLTFECADARAPLHRRALRLRQDDAPALCIGIAGAQLGPRHR